ncbi:hypothetical protein AB0I98_07495 [Streptomyces sp. NPDC050211]|uniref:hypothetical protein n=1 Tax=Streptomyces sp. NPDC050211 TaxID=3154932 RepID=UPI00341ED3D5
MLSTCRLQHCLPGAVNTIRALAGPPALLLEWTARQDKERETLSTQGKWIETGRVFRGLHVVKDDEQSAA